MRGAVMDGYKYRAGLVSESFWFHELKTVARLRQEGLDCAGIKKRCVEENLFGAAKEYRALRMAGYIINRVKTMDDGMMELFFFSDMATQKLINLITILRTDRLFFEFLYEVYREKVVLGDPVMEEADVNVFFTKKETQSQWVAGWKDSTKRRLRTCYLGFMTEANLLTEMNKRKMITPPVLDVALERYLKSRKEEMIIKALTGVN